MLSRDSSTTWFWFLLLLCLLCVLQRGVSGVVICIRPFFLLSRFLEFGLVGGWVYGV